MEQSETTHIFKAMIKLPAFCLSRTAEYCIVINPALSPKNQIFTTTQERRWTGVLTHSVHVC